MVNWLRSTVTPLAAALAVVVVGVLAPASPASAAGLSVSPAQGLDPAGQIVVVRGSGFRPGTALFVMECRASSAQDHTCNSVGLQKVTTDASGAFATRLSVVGRFGATDCLQVACGIKTSAVSGHADDRSQDTSTAISFRAAPPVTAPPVTAPPVTAPPATAPRATTPPATTTSTTVPPSTTTAPATSTTTADATSTTTTDETRTTPDDEEAREDSADLVAATSADEAPGGDGGSGGADGGSAPIGALAAGGVVAAALVAGGAVLRRRRTLA